MEPLLTRDQFRTAVFARDQHRCVNCGAPGDAAHHILERKLYPDGGYYLSNGATLCPTCHIEAEKTTLTVEEVRTLAGITSPALPPGFAADRLYDKWGNEILACGSRVRGAMIDDDGARKILTEAGILYGILWVDRCE